VDIYYRDGSVVITNAGDKTSVITAYGKIDQVRPSAVNPAQWSNSRAYVEINPANPNEAIYSSRGAWEAAGHGYGGWP